MKGAICSTCKGTLAAQENGKLACVNRACADHGNSDLITSCCLVDPRFDAGCLRCSNCGVPCEVDLTVEEAKALGSLMDYTGWGSEDPRPPEPDQLHRDMGVLLLVLRNLGVSVPNGAAAN